MRSHDYVHLDVTAPDRCGSDGSVTRTQHPCGDYLCPECVRPFRDSGWLDEEFKYTEAFFSAHRHHWWRRIYRKGRNGPEIDPIRLAAVLRSLLEAGATVEVALRRLHTEAQVKELDLVATLAQVLGVGIRDARRLVVNTVSGDGS